MRFEHWRARRQLALLAAGALGDAEQAAVRAHLDACPACRQELASLQTTLRLVTEGSPAAEPPQSAAATATAVLARLDARRPAAVARTAPPRLQIAFASAAAVILAVVALQGRTPPPAPIAVAPAGRTTAALLVRLERNLARDQTARYLSEAQDVLVGLNSPPPCRKIGEQVDLASETARSRELVARRVLLDLDQDPLAGARPVLEDVDQVLREVAALPACTRLRDLQAIQEQLERRRLLMKMDLVARELQG